MQSNTNQTLIERLEALMSQKKSKEYYATKLGISVQQVQTLINLIRGRGRVDNLKRRISEDLKGGSSEVIVDSPTEVRTLEELIDICKIDTQIWDIDKYVQNYWGNTDNPYWQVKAWLSKKKVEDVQRFDFQRNFKEFLKTFTNRGLVPPKRRIEKDNKPDVALVINKQDEHVNKFDIGGENSLLDRMSRVYTRIQLILEQTNCWNHIEKIYYIVGSDEFNSEWTNATTKGTPQQNVLPYQQSFAKICNYEVDTINLLRDYTDNIEIIYVPGNHDEYVGWHMITWLQAYYREDNNIKFDVSTSYRKYVEYGMSAIMFNHGDAIKPDKLAAMFPIEFKNNWSKYENYYIFTGDKHHEVSKDYTGIKFYQLPALSKAKSSWDDKQGHTCSKAELTAFIIDKYSGITGILKRPI